MPFSFQPPAACKVSGPRGRISLTKAAQPPFGNFGRKGLQSNLRLSPAQRRFFVGPRLP